MSHFAVEFGIKFSKEELYQHAQKLIEWWQTDKVIFEKYATSGNSEVIIEMSNRFSLFVESLDVVIIQNDLVDFKHSIGQMINDFQKLGLDYLRLKAISVKYLSLDIEKFVYEVEESLTSFEEKQVIDALRAINQLLCRYDNPDFRFIELLSTYIKYSRGQFLSSAFQVVANILHEKRTGVYSQIENSVLKTLGCVLAGFDLLGFEENLALRSKSAKLASDLNLYYVSNSKDVPAVLRLWADNCHSQQEFTEIRNQWKDC